MDNIVGARFAPTDEELTGHYLKKQNLGDTSVIHNAIGVVIICDYEPKFLPSLSKIKSDDLIWYFFTPKEYTSEKMSSRKRTTESGFWKPTGVDRKIKGGNGVEIGVKKTLVYYEGRVPNEVRTDWVIHEYDITSLPTDQNLFQTPYVVCKVMYKGDDFIPLAGDSLSEPNHSLAFHSDNLIAPPEVNPAVSTQPEPVQEENFNGMSMNHLEIPMMDLPPWAVLYSDTFNNNSYSFNVELQAPYLFHGVEDGYDPIIPFGDINTLNMWPQDPYITQDELEGLWQDSNTFITISNIPSGVGQQGQETRSEFDDFEPDSYIIDYDPNVELQPPPLTP